MNEIKKPFNLSSLSEMSHSTTLRDVTGRDSASHTYSLNWDQHITILIFSIYSFVDPKKPPTVDYTLGDIEPDDASVRTATLMDGTLMSMPDDSTSIVTGTNLSIMSSVTSGRISSSYSRTIMKLK